MFVKRQSRTEFGQLFEWKPTYKWWETRIRRLVCVIPPKNTDGLWLVVIPSAHVVHTLSGDDVESRAFCMAVGLSKQAD